MSQKNLFIVIIVVLGSLSTAYYSYDSSPGLFKANEEEGLNGDQLSDSGGQNNEVNTLGENREIKGREDDLNKQDNELDEENNIESDSSDQESLSKLNGIILDQNPVAGEGNRLRLLDEGERISGGSIYLNGDKIGETNNAGALRFTVPNTEEITITAGSGLYETTESVESYEPSSYIDINFNSISDEDYVDDYKVPVTVELETEVQTNYSILIDDKTIDSGGLQPTERQVYENIEIVQNKGSHKLAVEAVNENKGEQSKSVNFETALDAPDTVDIYSVDPEEESMITGNRTTFTWKAYAPENTSYEFVWSTSDFSDRDSPRVFEGEDGLTSYSLTWRFSQSGTYNYTIDAVNSENGNVISSKTTRVRYE